MWLKLSHFILRYRVALMASIIAITCFMGYHGQFIQWSFNMINIVPEEDPDMINFQEFKKTFGEDGNVMALGMQDSTLYMLDQFKEYDHLIKRLEKNKNISVISIPNIKWLVKNTQSQSFDFKQVINTMPKSQHELDSVLNIITNLQFYSDQLLNEGNGATLALVAIDKDILNSKRRDQLTASIIREIEVFENATQIDVKIAGLPYVRYAYTLQVKRELKMFLVFMVVISGIILFMFFRSLKAVLFPIIIILIVVTWVLGTLSLLEYKITLLSGLIPPIIVVIGIPNSIYMLNKYHQEYSQHGDQMKALSRIIRKIGTITFITNLTTAVGFLVLASTNIDILKEFGVAAGINIMATFLVSIIMIPSIFSFYKPPTKKHLRHLDFKTMDWALSFCDFIVHRHRLGIFVVTILVVILSFIGLSKIKALSYVVDDLSEKNTIIQEMRFFERNFGGVMPLEIIVNTGQKKGVENLRNLKKVDELETHLSSLPFLSKPISIVGFTKASRQAFYNQNADFYALPTSRDVGYITKYLKSSELGTLSNSFVDSTGQIMRVSLRIADIGSNKLDTFITKKITPVIDKLFKDSKLDVKLTGSTLIFIKGNKFLIKSLITSMILAFVIIAIIMALLFKNFKMIVISLIPNIIPLMITAGIMGYFSIPLKPSTALIFSIAFGISIDNSIHFLAKYRQELLSNNFYVSLAVSKTLRETGSSIIYTNIILFCGFIIFVLSEFGGTISLGKLTSITLFFAMLTNIIVLPGLIIQFDKRKYNNKSLKEKNINTSETSMDISNRKENN